MCIHDSHLSATRCIHPSIQRSLPLPLSSLVCLLLLLLLLLLVPPRCTHQRTDRGLLGSRSGTCAGQRRIRRWPGVSRKTASESHHHHPLPLWRKTERDIHARVRIYIYIYIHTRARTHAHITERRRRNGEKRDSNK